MPTRGKWPSSSPLPPALPPPLLLLPLFVDCCLCLCPMLLLCCHQRHRRCCCCCRVVVATIVTTAIADVAVIEAAAAFVATVVLLLLPSSSAAHSCCLLPPASWLCGRWHSLTSHHPPLMLPMLVDCCFSPLTWTRRVWGHNLPLLFIGLVLVQRCRGCGVATAGMVIPALTSGQFQPSPLPGACATGASCRRGGGQGCLCLTQFPSCWPWFRGVFFVMRGCACVESM